jgi:CHAT domain-containing protein
MGDDAAVAISNMAARFAVGTSALAAKVRQLQDQASRRELLDKAVANAISADRRNEERVAELRRELAATEVSLKAAKVELERDFPNYAELTSPRPLGLAETQRLLAAEEALVMILPEAEDETFVWAITRASITWQRIQLDNKALANKVANIRKGLDQEDLQKAAEVDSLFDLGLAHELYATVLGPVADVIKDKRHLLIVASGSLTSLPFQLLVREKPATPKPDRKQLVAYRDAAWLIKRHAITVLPSVSSLKALRVMAKGGQGSRPFVGYGDPIFSRASIVVGGLDPQQAASVGISRTRGYASYFSGARPDLKKLSEGLAPLPETAQELNAVAKRLNAPDSDVHLGTEATEAAVKRADLTPFRVVYFATHGLVGGEVKGLAEPALVLTLPAEATDLDDGLLTASEVAQLKLNADWVVLSACNTAAGEKPGAEALSGLARAFFYAGARALLVSHWRVDSEAAARLTTGTFEALQKDPTIGRAEALRSSMLAYMNNTSSPWNAYPDYWAPFSVVGEGGAR